MTHKNGSSNYFSMPRRSVLLGACAALIGACGGANEPADTAAGARPEIEQAERALVGGAAAQGANPTSPAGRTDRTGWTGRGGAAAKAGGAPPALTSNIIALVDGQPVTVDEFTRAFPLETLERMPDYLRRQYAGFIQQLIENRVMAVAAEHEDFSDDPAYQAELEEAVRQVKMRYYYARHVSAGVRVSDEDVKQYYQKHLKEYSVPDRLRVRHILVEVKRGAHPAEVSNAYNRAVELRQRIQEGEPFATLALNESSCPSRTQGGDLGYVQRGQLVPEVERAAFALRGNELSPVIQSEFGYHIVQVTDRVAGRRRTLEEVRDEIRDRLIQERERARYQEVLQQLTNTYKVIRNEQVIQELVHRRW